MPPRTPAVRVGGSPEAPPGPRLVASQLRRIRRIVDAAVALAEQGGFEAVRLRDVGDRSGVSLGTLYRYFRSKEDLLLFVFAEMIDGLELGMRERPPRGETSRQRASDFFERTTRGLAQRPQLGRAVIRALATAGHETLRRSADTRQRVHDMLTTALRGKSDAGPASARERDIADILLAVWHASALAWSSGQIESREIIEKTRTAAALLLTPEGGSHG